MGTARTLPKQRGLRFTAIGSVDNLLRVWDMTDRVDFDEGMLAYQRYHDTLGRIAKHYGYPIEAIVGAFAALSPNNTYLANIRSVITAICGGKGAGYTACHERALRCLRGDHFLSFTKGQKTRSFFMNIMDPYDPEPVTIDGHMYGCWIGRRQNMKEAVEAKFNYDEIADGFQVATGRIGCGLLPCQFQATLWFTWKRINKMVFEPQMSLLRAVNDDQWGLDLEPENI